jgi:hypothetical protein
LNPGIINELNNGNPVVIVLPRHKEVVWGYEFSDDGFRLLTNDVGFQNDKYIDLSTMLAYNYDGDKKVYSKEYGPGKKIINDRRHVKDAYVFK